MVSNLEKASHLQLKSITSDTKFKKKVWQFAAGWYIAMTSKEFKKLGKQPKAIQLFDQPLVVWRDAQGKPAIMERFCSHMGASLATGKLIDGCIQCPFHHWHYDSSGQCVNIPDLAAPKIERIPSTARQTTYVTQERYGYIWIWYGSKTPLYSLPKYDAAEENKETHKYMSYRFSYKLHCHALRMIENSFDHTHVVTVHGVSLAEPIELTMLNEQDVKDDELPIPKEAWIGGTMNAKLSPFTGVQGIIAKALKFDFKIMDTRMDAWASGIRCIMMVDGKERYKVLTNFIPISHDEVVMHAWVLINKTGNLFTDLVAYMIFGFANHIFGKRDKPLFDALNEHVGGAFVETDRVVLKVRELHQRWVDMAD